jgi:hypothetical protein
MFPVMLAAAAGGLITAGVISAYFGLLAGGLSLPFAAVLSGWVLIRLLAWHRRDTNIERSINKMTDDIHRIAAADRLNRNRAVQEQLPY